MAHRHCRLNKIEIFFMSIYILWSGMNRDGRMKAEDRRKRKTIARRTTIYSNWSDERRRASAASQTAPKSAQVELFCLSSRCASIFEDEYFTLNYSKLTFPFSSSFFTSHRCCLKIKRYHGNCHHKSRRG